MPEAEPFLTSGDVAKRLGVSPRAVANWVSQGLLTPAVITMGGRYRFLWSEVVDQMKQARKTDS